MSVQQSFNLGPNKLFSAQHFLVALVLIVWGQIAYAESSPEAYSWLERMSAALQKVNYQGVFVYSQDEQLSAMQVTHVASPQGEHELLVSLTGEEREALRNSQGLSSLILQDKDAPLDQHMAVVEKYYDLKLAGRDRTAGRFTRLLVVKPKDEFRYGYRLWLDEETGLLLKSDLLGSDGQVLEQIMFTSLELMDNSAAEQFRTMIGLTDQAPKEDAARQSDWTVTNVPEGFIRLQNDISADSGADHIIFSDGLASVSVFIEEAKENEKSFVGISRRGAVNVYGGLLNGYQVTVVGEVPTATVRLIGQSIIRQEVAVND